MDRIIRKLGREQLLPALLLLSFFLFYFVPLNAQLKYDYEWLIGYNNAPIGEFDPNSRFAMNLISFHNHPPDTIRTRLRGSTGSSNTMSFANSQGELLFYSNGCRLFDSEGNIVSGGEQLNTGTIFEQYCRGHSSEYYPQLAQSMIMLPMDDKDSMFFLIHSRLELTHNTDWSSPYGIVNFDVRLTKIVENTMTDGYKVISSEIVHPQLTAGGNFTAVRYVEPNYWWVIAAADPHKRNYESILIGPEGLDTVISNEVTFEGLPFDDGRLLVNNGQVAVSPDGTTYIRWMPHDTVGILIWDFDRTTGLMSNLKHVEHPEKYNWNSGSPFGGASISPNNRFLYINTRNNLYQYDLFSEEISSSKVHIAEYNGFTDPKNNLEVAFYLQKLAPNCKIYMSATNTVRFLHVIYHPNKKGLDCDFRQHSFVLPGNHGIGLPYHPNYNLDTEYPVCDSNLATATTWFIPDEAEPGIYLYPNPAREYAKVGWSDIEPVEIALYDMSGREVYSSRMQPDLPEYYLDLSGLSAGVYVVRVRDRSGGVGVERLVVF